MRATAALAGDKKLSPTAPRQLRLALPDTRVSETFRHAIAPPAQLRTQTKEFGRALVAALGAQGISACYDARHNAVSLWGARIRIRLVWPSEPGEWVLHKAHRLRTDPLVLLARMSGLNRPVDFFLLPGAILPNTLQLTDHRAAPPDLRKYWCASGEHLMARLSKLCVPLTKSFPAPVRRRRPGTPARGK
jgi:hypothetical protein